jgi:hypothetical protein
MDSIQPTKIKFNAKKILAASDSNSLMKLAYVALDFS